MSIGIDGSLYEHHPRFHDHMTVLLQNLVPNTKVNALFRSSMYKVKLYIICLYISITLCLSSVFLSFVCTFLSLSVYRLSFCCLSVHFYHLVFIVCLSVVCLYISITSCLSLVFLFFVCTFLSLHVYRLSFRRLSVHFYHLVFIVCLSVFCLYISIT